MTRLTDLSLYNVRGENPETIPFPTQFCNMIYLQKLVLSKTFISGFVKRIDHIVDGPFS